MDLILIMLSIVKYNLQKVGPFKIVKPMDLIAMGLTICTTLGGILFCL